MKPMYEIIAWKAIHARRAGDAESMRMWMAALEEEVLRRRRQAQPAPAGEPGCRTVFSRRSAKPKAGKKRKYARKLTGKKRAVTGMSEDETRLFIRDAWKGSGMKLVDFAAALGISPSTLSHQVQGDNYPSQASWDLLQAWIARFGDSGSHKKGVAA